MTATKPKESAFDEASYSYGSFYGTRLGHMPAPANDDDRLAKICDQVAEVLKNQAEMLRNQDEIRKGQAEILKMLKWEAGRKRKPLTELTKRHHLSACRQLGGMCPCCGTNPVVNQDGTKVDLAEYDHAYGPNVNDVHHTWLICGDCHDGFTYGRIGRMERRDEFAAYQRKRDRLPGQQIGLFPSG